MSKLGQILVEAGLIDSAQLDAALSHQAQTGQMLGEALLELGYISETDLLQALAKVFETQYVSTEKLSRASVPGNLLELVPVKLAEEQLVFPILLSKDGSTLGLVSAEPQNAQAIEETRIVSGKNKVQVFVANRDAIRALIKKHYRGDIHAFDVLDRSSKAEFDNMMEMYGNRVLDNGSNMEMEERAQPLSSGPVIDVSEDSDPSYAAERSSSWTQAIEAVRGGSLFSDNDFIETLNIMVGLIEVHIPSRQGHSAAVAKMVKNISERMGVEDREINHNVIASYLHDMGKRASSHLTLLSIANKAEYRKRAQRYHLTPSRLFDSVHLPPQVNHVLSHLYENFGGKGLPEKLSGNRIPLGARIIAVVDAFEDLTNNNENYLGDTIPSVEALARIDEHAGRLFDPEVVEALSGIVRGEAAEVTSAGNLVLVADPDTSATSVLELKLLQEGFQVRVARDSDEALDCIEEQNLTGVVVEMHLQPDDGFFIMEKVQESGQDIPVFMVAQDAQPEAITKAFKNGVADFIPKPLVPEVLVAKLLKEVEVAPAPDDQAQPPGPVLSSEAVSLQQDIVIEVEPESDSESATPTGHEPEARLPTPSSVSYSGAGGSKGAVLSGSLEGKSALSLIRALVAKKRSGLLALRQAERKGKMFLEGGQIFQAVLGEIGGEEAFLELASWHDCLYRFDPEQRPRSRAIKTSTAKLLQIASLSQ